MLTEAILAGNLLTSDIGASNSSTEIANPQGAYIGVVYKVHDTVVDVSNAGNNVGTNDVEEIIRMNSPFCKDDIPYELPDPSRVSLIQQWEQKIFKKLSFPHHWEKEGISKPNIEAKNQSLKIVDHIFDKYREVPSRISSSKEEGVYILYEFITAWDDRSLIIESYNDLDVALIVTDNNSKQILYSEDVNEMNFFNAIEIFKKYAA